MQANQVGGSGVGSAANEPLQDQQMLDVTDLDAEEPQLETLRDNTRQKILKHVEEMQRLATQTRWTTTIQPHVQSAMIELNRMWAFSTINGTTVPTLGITRGPLSSAAMDPLNAYMGTSLPEEAPGEHVNTELSLGLNCKRQRSAASNNNNLVANMVNTPGTNSIMPKPNVGTPCACG